MKRFLILTAAFVAAVAVFAFLTVPPRRLTLGAGSDGSVHGILHVHTNRSDGLSGPDDVAAAAARAGLKFVVFTDHGDATRKPNPPTYRSGVLCLDGVEISTRDGHYVALDMPAAPYPLGGEARDVVEDVKRLGGFGIAAHPDSPKAELQWHEWAAPFDGIELLNLDTGWRVLAQADARSKWRLFAALVDYPLRSPEVIASLIQPTGALSGWEALTRSRRVVTVAGADAHSRLDLWNADPGQARFALPIPNYESAFRVMSVHVRLDRPLSGDADADAAALMRAIRAGHLYVAVDAVASPPAFEFRATSGAGTASEGDELKAGTPVTLHVRSNAPSEFTTILHDGIGTIAANRGAAELTVHSSDRPAVYWVEIVSTGRPRPLTWLRSNPIYVRAARQSVQPAVRPSPTTSTPLFDGRTKTGWFVESDPTSLSALDVAARVGGSELRFRYGLSDQSGAGPYSGLVRDTPKGAAAYDRLTFTARAEQPTRISVQLRSLDAGGKVSRWQRSVYLDTVDREQMIYFDDLTPVGTTEPRHPALADVHTILFVVDTTNTKPGTSARLWIRSAVLQK